MHFYRFCLQQVNWKLVSRIKITIFQLPYDLKIFENWGKIEKSQNCMDIMSSA